MIEIGEIKELYRYPVKSFQGERIALSKVEPYGMYGDRARYFVDHSRGGKHLSAKQVPGLLGYSAKYVGQPSGDGFPSIEIESPDGRKLQWDDELWREIASLSGRPLSARTFSPDNEDLAAVDVSNILLATDVSLREVGELVGSDADMRRFRPNIVLRRGAERPFEEFEWLGRTIRLGEVELKITKKCERCSMVNVDPERLTVETKFLKKLGEQWDACFGIYADVVKTGTLRVGDKAILVD